MKLAHGPRLDALSARLVSLSAAAADPASRFDWAATPPDRLAMPEAMVSLFHTSAWATLSDAARHTVARLELARFFSLSIAGEAELLRGLAPRQRATSPGHIRAYLEVFGREEEQHTAVFTRFSIAQAGRVYPDRQLRLPRELLEGEEDFLYHAEVLLFEEVTSWLNRKMASDEAIWPLSRQINAWHAEEEARHIAFGKEAVLELWGELSPAWGEAGRAAVKARLEAYVGSLFAQMADPAVYRDAGLDGNVHALRREAMGSEGLKALHAAAAAPARRLVARLAA